jgi:thiamine pyrophosphate-dependent acetolactate synthase large subunit-like protein
MSEQTTAGVKVGAAQVTEYLAARGQRHVFGLPGSSSVAFYHELQRSPVEYIQAVHESVAISMADGYARATGGATSFIYMLPGTGNGLANLYNAWRDETPLLVLASQQATEFRSELGTTGEAEIDDIAKPFARLSREVPSGASLEWWLDTAFQAASGPPSGPAFLSVPEEILEREAIASTDRPPSVRSMPVAGDISAVTDALGRSVHPMIVVGGQVQRCGGTAALEALASEAAIPVALEPGWNDRLSIAPGHPNYLGSFSMPDVRALEAAADVVIILGCRFFREAHPTRDRRFPNAELVVHINLDTSLLSATWTADWSAAVDPADFLARLLDEHREHPPSASVMKERAEWLDRAQQGVRARDGGEYAVAVEAMADVLDHGWVVDESVTASYALVDAMEATDGTRYTTTGGASLGWATGAACGVAAGTDEHVTCVLGDGALLFGVHGLWTARAYDLPITFVILDNEGYGSTRRFTRMYASRAGETPPARYIGSDFRGRGPGSASVLEGFGIPTQSVAIGEDPRPALTKAWAANELNGVVISVPRTDAMF